MATWLTWMTLRQAWYLFYHGNMTDLDDIETSLKSVLPWQHDWPGWHWDKLDICSTMATWLPGWHWDKLDICSTMATWLTWMTLRQARYLFYHGNMAYLDAMESSLISVLPWQHDWPGWHWDKLDICSTMATWLTWMLWNQAWYLFYHGNMTDLDDMKVFLFQLFLLLQHLAVTIATNKRWHLDMYMYYIGTQ